MQTPRQKYVLRPGDVVFAKKGSVLTMSQTHEDFCEVLVFVPDTFIKTVIRKYQLAPTETGEDGSSDTVIPLVPDQAIRSYFESLLSYFSMSRPPAEKLLKLKFEELIVHLVSGRKSKPLLGYFHKLCAGAKPSIREIMETNYSSNLAIGEFARLCARSPSAFKREFGQIYGVSPGKWLKERRLEYGKYLLETTDMNISEVCLECGFTNRSHFHKAFREKYGTTPTQVAGG